MNATNCQNTWKQDISTLEAFRSDCKDRLDVVQEHLQLEKGTLFRKFQTPISSDSLAVANHIETLITVTAPEIFRQLRQSKTDDPAFYEKVADFKREVKVIIRTSSDLEYLFRSHRQRRLHFKDLDNPLLAQKYQTICSFASEFKTGVDDFKSSLPKPSLATRPPKSINYDERDAYRVMEKHFYPTRVPLETTVAAANKALALAQKPPQWSFFDWMLGTLTVRNELHMQAYQHFTRQIFHRPYITEDVATAFESLASHATLLDLKHTTLGSTNPEDFKLFIKECTQPNALSLADFLIAIKEIYGENAGPFDLETCSKLYGKITSRYDSSLQMSEIREMIKEDNLDKKDSRQIIYIHQDTLKRLLLIAANSPTCRTIEISASLTKIPFVNDLLVTHHYQHKQGSMRLNPTYVRAPQF